VDTQFSPINVCTLAAGHRAAEGDRLLFDRQEERWTKTGRPATGTLSRRTERLVAAYQKTSFCFAIGPRRLIGKTHWPTISSQRARSSSPTTTTVSWTYADQEPLRPLLAVPTLSLQPPKPPTRSTAQVSSTGPMPVALATVGNADEARSKRRRKMWDNKSTDSSATGSDPLPRLRIIKYSILAVDR